MNASTSERLDPKFTAIHSWRKLVDVRDHIISLPAGSRASSDNVAKRQRYFPFIESMLRRCSSSSCIVAIVSAISLAVLVLPTVSLAGVEDVAGKASKVEIRVCQWRNYLALLGCVAFVAIPSMISWTFRKHAPLPSMTKFTIIKERGYYMDPDFVDGVHARNATEQRGIAFGLTAILSELLQTPLPRPNYSAPVNLVFRTLSEQILQATKFPRALITAALNHSDSQPSWVTDWSLKPPSYWIDP